MGPRKKLGAAWGILLLLVTACGPAAEVATPTRTPAPAATAPSVSTPTPQPAGVTPSPATPTPRPTSTPTQAPASQPKSGGVVKMAAQEEDQPWDAHKNTSGALTLRSISNLVFQPLGTIPATKETECKVTLRPELAESWSWTNDNTLEVKLRKGIKFQNKPPVNGRELTAQDVVHTWKRLFTYNLRRFMTEANSTKDIVAVDPYTVRFLTKGPLPSLIPAALVNHFGTVIVPPDAGWGMEQTVTHPAGTYIGTGPFMYSQWLPGVKFVTQKNPDYWKKGLPYVDGIEFVVMPDSSTRTAALLSGKLDLWYDYVPTESANMVLRVAPQIKSRSCPGTNPELLYMRTDIPPFNDVRVRRALAMSFDRETLVKVVFGGKGMLSTVLGPPLHPLYAQKSDLPTQVQKYLEYHPDEAKKLLAEAGFAGGLPIGFLHSTSTNFNRQLAEASMAMMEAVGFKVTMQWMLQPQWTITRGQDYKHITKAFMTLDYGFPNFFKFMSTELPDRNMSRVSDPKLDSLSNVLAVTLDEKRQRELALEIQALIADQAYVIALPVGMESALLQPWVQDFYLGTSGASVRFTSTWAENIWLDK